MVAKDIGTISIAPLSALNEGGSREVACEVTAFVLADRVDELGAELVEGSVARRVDTGIGKDSSGVLGRNDRRRRGISSKAEDKHGHD